MSIEWEQQKTAEDARAQGAAAARDGWYMTANPYRHHRWLRDAWDAAWVRERQTLDLERRVKELRAK